MSKLKIQGVDRRSPFAESVGECAEMINTTVDASGVKMLKQFTVAQAYMSQLVILHTHRTESVSRLILTDRAKKLLYYLNYRIDPIQVEDPIPVEMDVLSGDELITSSLSYGNILILNTSSSRRYFILREGSYKYMGIKPPMPDIVFYPVPERIDGGDVPVDLKNDGLAESDFVHPRNNLNEELNPATKIYLTTIVQGLVNKQIYDLKTERRFAYPILVRYALRLYDGTLSYHSPPILIDWNAMEDFHLYPYLSRMKNNIFGGGSSARIGELMVNIKGTVSRVEMEIKKDPLLLWMDIVKSVDIFISPQIPTFNLGGVYNKLSDSDYLFSQQHGLYDHPPGGKWYDFGSGFPMSAPTPLKNVIDIESQTKDSSIFYLVRSIPIDNEEQRYHNIVDDNTDLLKLETYEVMTDEYHSHHQECGMVNYLYNSRLHCGNIKSQLFGGFDPLKATPLQIVTGGAYKYYESHITIELENRLKKSLITRHIAYDSDITRYTIKPVIPQYVYYPDSRAKRFWITYRMSIGGTIGYQTFEGTFEPHSFLSGAVSYGKNRESVESSLLPDIHQQPNINETIEDPNLLMVSTSSNPFYFEPLGNYMVGNGDIRSICASTIPISQGQFGQYPLYVFCSDGIWAMQVSQTGIYQITSPLSTEICVSAATTPVAGSILFFTKKGVASISGATVQYLSDRLMGGYDLMPDMAKHIATDTKIAKTSMFDSCVFNTDFESFLSEARIASSYTNGLLYLTNPGHPYCWVYNINTSSWSKHTINISSFSNSSDQCIAIVNDREIVNLQESLLGYCSTSEYIPFFISTKPFRVDLSFLGKIGEVLIGITGLISSGRRVSVLISGSMDGINFYPVADVATKITDIDYRSVESKMRARIQGLSYKYYIISISGTLKADSIIGDIEILPTTTLNNKLR